MAASSHPFEFVLFLMRPSDFHFPFSHSFDVVFRRMVKLGLFYLMGSVCFCAIRNDGKDRAEVLSSQIIQIVAKFPPHHLADMIEFDYFINGF
jgi:HD superfamily phosphohydrolase